MQLPAPAPARRARLVLLLGLLAATLAAGVAARVLGRTRAARCRQRHHGRRASDAAVALRAALDRGSVLRGGDGLVRVELRCCEGQAPRRGAPRAADRPRRRPRPLGLDGWRAAALRQGGGARALRGAAPAGPLRTGRLRERRRAGAAAGARRPARRARASRRAIDGDRSPSGGTAHVGRARPRPRARRRARARPAARSA